MNVEGVAWPAAAGRTDIGALNSGTVEMDTGVVMYGPRPAGFYCCNSTVNGLYESVNESPACRVDFGNRGGRPKPISAWEGWASAGSFPSYGFHFALVSWGAF
jgi:hypothetical protein